MLLRFTVDMLEEVTGKEGESITLGCAAIGFPAPRITWKRAGGGSLPKHVSIKSPLLHISHLQLQDQVYKYFTMYVNVFQIMLNHL